MESAELIAILREVRERVREQRPEGVPVADLMGLVHARDSALGKVAAIGTVNPRSGGLSNSVVQAWKRLVARVLDWHVREQVEFNRQVLACVDAAIEALNEDNRVLVELGGRIAAAQENLRAAQESLGQDIQAAQESLGRDIQAAQDRLGRDITAAQEGLGEEIRIVEERLGPELADIRKHWAEWRAGWEHKLAQNEIQFLRSVADLQGAFQHRATLMDMSFRETVRGQHADFTGALERSAVEIQKRLWLEFERTIHAELRIIRQRSQVVAVDAAGAGHARPVQEQAPGIDMARFALCFRGSEEYVKGGQRQYVANFEGCQNVLDIGCGRGEFLEIMREANIPAVGIDLSGESVAICRLKGLQAETADLFTYLAGLPEESLDGIFCAQVVEHLPPERLPEMIQLCAGRLGRNGVMVIETPNPECLAIFATHFYLDPTHARPIPHKLLAFYLEESGVGVMEVRKLAPAVESMPSLGLLPEAFREAFFGGLDYAIIGKKL